jgi:hypothetical protein
MKRGTPQHSAHRGGLTLRAAGDGATYARGYCRDMRLLVSILAVLLALASPAFAQHEHEHDHEHEHEHERGHASRGHGGWQDRDIHRFHEHDLAHWRSGAWHHGSHAGRSGWWWVVGGVWYFYPAPVYPYPDPYAPPAAAPPSPAPTTYYYCDDPAGYYPYVPECRTPWRPMGAQP